MTRYTVGFFFMSAGVILIKPHAGPRAGLWNGLGGKIEPGEGALDAMIREFQEECGLETTPDDWRYIVTMLSRDEGEDWELHCFAGHNKDVDPADIQRFPLEGDIGVFDGFPVKEATDPTAAWMIRCCLDVVGGNFELSVDWSRIAEVEYKKSQS